jgi:tetratricopeptide (TPR) repeat protein
MQMCLICGFVSYPSAYNKQGDLKEFYRHDYRDVPNVNNVYAGQRKLHYHNEFLRPVFQKWKGNSELKICEIGSAFGMFLQWVKTELPQASVFGTELTLSFRRVAFHEYGIKLDEEIDTTQKYDLIASYKVAEHIPHIDKELIKYKECLTEKGLLYISVPTWFNSMTNFGVSGFNLEYYYHKNHCNVWTTKLFETLLKKCGLEIVRSNHVYYDSTYLCQRNDNLMKETPEYENPQEILQAMEAIKKASLAFDNQDFHEAVKIWPNYPEAQIARFEKDRAQVHKKGFQKLHDEDLKAILEACPNSSAAVFFAGDICMRYNQWHLALDYLNKGLEMRPNDPTALIAVANCFRQLAEASEVPEEKLKFFREARQVMKFLQKVSFQHAHESLTWLFNDSARLPIPGEVES